MSMSKLDQSQIIKYVYDESAHALKTSIVSTDMSIELSHADGDSVLTYGATINAIASTGVAIPCGNYKKIAIYSVAPTGLVVSASADGILYVPIDSTNAVYIIKDLCAKFVKLTFSAGTVQYVLQG